jgi:hypothetical protein
MRTWSGVVVVGSVSLVAPVFLLAGTADAATPVAIWNMDDPGRMTDSSGNGNNSSSISVGSVADGVSGNAYRFGANSSVTVPNSASLNPGTADFGFTAHVRFPTGPSAATGDYDLIRKGVASTGGGEWKMEIFPGGGYTSPAFCLFKDALGKTATLRGTKNLADGAWHALTCAKTAKGISLTVDGVTKSSTVTLGSISNNQALSVGRKLGGGDQYVGDMDEVRVEMDGSVPAGDTTPPTVATAPAGGATGVVAGADVTASFNEPVQGVAGTTFKLKRAGSSTAVSATVTYNATTRVATLNPAADLAAGAQYTATLTGGATAIRDLAGNPLATTTSTFTVASAGSDPAPPTVTAVAPANGRTGVSRTANVTVAFSEGVTNVTTTTFTLAPAAGGAAVSAAVTFNSTSGRWVLNPGVTLAANTSYTATITSGVTDLAGNAFAGTMWTFTTGA